MRLRELRVRKLYSVRGLAKEAQVSEKSIRAIEAGEWGPSLATIRKLSAILEAEPMEVDEFKVAMEKAMEGANKKSG